MAENPLEIQGISILLKKSLKAKKLTIKIRPKDGVVLTVPWYYPVFKAKDFANLHIDWIKSNLEKMEKHKKKLIIFDENSDFSTKKHKLCIQKKDIKKSTASIKNSQITVKFPIQEDISSEQNQQKIRAAIIEAFRIEAKEYLPVRVEYFSQKFNLKYKDLCIKNMKSRWGSCSGHNNINLNLHLIRLPDELIDYVILHELAHIKEKNHSKKFWDFLSTILPHSKELNKKLKFYKMDLL